MKKSSKSSSPPKAIFPTLSLLSRRGPVWKLQTIWPSDSYSSLRQSLIRLLLAGHSERLDMAPLLERFAMEHRGWYRSQLQRLTNRIRQGTSLVDALEQTPGLLTPDQVLAIRFGTQTGTLREAYQSLLDQRSVAEGENQIRQASVYWIVLLCMLLLITSYLMMFTLPFFRRITDEFELKLPQGLLYLERVKDWLIRYPLLVFLILAVVSYVFISGIVERRIASVMSLLIRSNNESKSSAIVRLLAIAIRAGRPLGGAVSTLAKYHPSSETRRRLLVARNDMEQGIDPWQSLASSRILTPRESLAVQLLPDNPSRAWFLDTIAQERESRTDSRGQWVWALMHPIVILVFGAIVLFIAKSFMGMNIMLIESLS